MLFYHHIAALIDETDVNTDPHQNDHQALPHIAGPAVKAAQDNAAPPDHDRHQHPEDEDALIGWIAHYQADALQGHDDDVEISVDRQFKHCYCSLTSILVMALFFRWFRSALNCSAIPKRAIFSSCLSR